MSADVDLKWTYLWKVASRPGRPAAKLAYNPETPRLAVEGGTHKDADCCIISSASKEVLVTLGVGRQVHHVLPYAQEGHRGPIVPICTHCHPVVTDRQRIYWFYRRVVLQSAAAEDADDLAMPDETPAHPRM